MANERPNQMTRSQQATQRAKADGSRMAEIVATAAKIFRKKGYAATSIQDIADEVGMLKGSLYHYIDTKDDLLFAIVGRMTSVTGHLVELAEAGLDEKTVLPTMVEIIRGHVTLEAENRVESTVFFRDGRHLKGQRRAEVLSIVSRYEVSWRELLEQGQRSGDIRDDLDPQIAAAGILGMLNSIHIWYLSDRQHATTEQIVSVYRGIILGGVLTPAAALRVDRVSPAELPA